MTRYVITSDVALQLVAERVAWRIAEQLGRDDTLDAEYIALTQPQADALITLDDELASAVGDLVVVAPIDELP